MPDHGLAVDIAEDLLFRTGKSLQSGDFEDFFTCFDIPQVMETLEGEILLRSKADVQSVFESVRSYYIDNNISDLVRTVVSAEFIDEETVGTTHVSRLMQPGGVLFRKPYAGYSIIKHLDGKWKIVTNTYAILDGRDHNLALLARRKAQAATEATDEM
jgi:hypothetical protein